MNLENYTLVELRQLAKEKEIKNSSKLKKDELIQELSKMIFQDKLVMKQSNLMLMLRNILKQM